MFWRAKLEVARNKPTFLVPFSIKYICLAIKNIVWSAQHIPRFPIVSSHTGGGEGTRVDKFTADITLGN